MTGPCISLADIPESKVVTTNNVLKEYEEIYRSITAKVSKEVEGEFGKL